MEIIMGHFIQIIVHIIRQKFSLLINGIKSICRGIRNYFSESMEHGIQFVCKIPWYIFAFILAINFVIGFFILYCNHCFSYFFMHLVCLTLNIIITVNIGKKYLNTLIILDHEIIENHTSENTELKMLYLRFKKYALHRCNLFACPLILVLFFWGIISQHYIKADIVGLYAVFLVNIVVSISVIGYIQYLWMLWFLYRISQGVNFHFNKNVPAQTPILVEIAQLLETAKWCFFLEGFLYVFEYYILIPKGKISPNMLNMPDNTSFLITWFVLLVVIILAFPVIILAQESFLAKIVDNLKNQIVHVLSQEFEDVESGEITDKFMYNAMIKNILSSEDYPVKSKRFGPALISIATFCLHTVSFFSQIPSLDYLFQSIGS